MPIATMSGVSQPDVQPALETKLPGIAKISYEHCRRWQSITDVAFTDYASLLDSLEIKLGGA